MSAVSCELDHSQRSASEDKSKATIVNSYIVRTDDPADDGGVALSASGLPAMFQVHPDISFMAVASRRAQPESEMPDVWHVTITYDSITVSEPNPTSRPPEISCDSQTYELPIDVDFTSLDITNSAGDYYDPPVMVPTFLRTITVVVFMDPFASLAATNYENKTNSSTWHGGAAQTWLCTKVGFVSVYEGDDLFYKTTFQFLYNPATHKRLVLNQGFNYLDGSTKKPIIKEGVPVSSPQPLDTDGSVLDPSDPPHWYEYQIYDDVSFDGLPF